MKEFTKAAIGQLIDNYLDGTVSELEFINEMQVPQLMLQRIQQTLHLPKKALARIRIEDLIDPEMETPEEETEEEAEPNDSSIRLDRSDEFMNALKAFITQGGKSGAEWVEPEIVHRIYDVPVLFIEFGVNWWDRRLLDRLHVFCDKDNIHRDRVIMCTTGRVRVPLWILQKAIPGNFEIRDIENTEEFDA